MKHPHLHWFLSRWLLPVCFCALIGAMDHPRVRAEDKFDWPGIRGPEWNGISRETGIADSWPKEGPPVLWTRQLGQGYSSFVAWDDRIATQYQSLSGQYVICMNADTGETIWEYRYDWPYDPAGVYPGPRSTPTYHEDKLYFASPAGLVGCLSAKTGTLLWSVKLAEQFKCELTGFGYSCTPTLVDGMVILPVGAKSASMVALDAKTGAVKWQAGNDAGSYSPAFPISLEGRPLVLGYLENVLVCHDRVTGEVLWRHQLSQGYDEHSSWPLYREPHLWISSPFRQGSELLELSSDPESPVKSLSKRELMSNDIFSSVLVDGAIYGFDVRDPQAKTHRTTRGIFRCIDFETGQEYWSIGDGQIVRENSSVGRTKTANGEVPNIGHATVIAAGGKLILFNDLGELILARATTERYEELARVSVLGGEICWTQPALSRGRLFVRNQSQAACLFLGAPETLEQEARSRAVTAAEIPQAEYFDWAGVILGVEPEYAFDLPSSTWLRRWFLICLAGIMGGSLFVVAAVRMIPWFRRSSGACQETVYWGIVFIAGACGTTYLSMLLKDFTFTWPVCLFAAFQVFVNRVTLKHQQLTRRNWKVSGTVCLVFIAVCLFYFLICRRLSLVFEWVFLVGFPGAVPFSLAATHLFATRRFHFAWKVFATALAFAAFYWSSIVFMHAWVR